MLSFDWLMISIQYDHYPFKGNETLLSTVRSNSPPKTGLPYFFSCKTGLFSFQKNPKDLDPSYKMDLGLYDCFGRVKLVLQQNFIGLV